MINKELQKRILSSIILIPIAIFFIVQGSVFFIFFLSISFFVTSYEWFKMSKNLSKKTFGIIFLLYSFYHYYEHELILQIIVENTCYLIQKHKQFEHQYQEHPV